MLRSKDARSSPTVAAGCVPIPKSSGLVCPKTGTHTQDLRHRLPWRCQTLVLVLVLSFRFSLSGGEISNLFVTIRAWPDATNCVLPTNVQSIPTTSFNPWLAFQRRPGVARTNELADLTTELKKAMKNHPYGMTQEVRDLLSTNLLDSSWNPADRSDHDGIVEARPQDISKGRLFADSSAWHREKKKKPNGTLYEVTALFQADLVTILESQNAMLLYQAPYFITAKGEYPTKFSFGPPGSYLCAIENGNPVLRFEWHTFTKDSFKGLIRIDVNFKQTLYQDGVVMSQIYSISKSVNWYIEEDEIRPIRIEGVIVGYLVTARMIFDLDGWDRFPNPFGRSLDERRLTYMRQFLGNWKRMAERDYRRWLSERKKKDQ